MQRPIDIVFKLSESFEHSGGFVTLNNGSKVHLYGSNIQAVWDIQESLNFNFILHFQDWTPAVALVGNGTYDWGVPLMSLSKGLVKEGLDAGCGLDFLHPLIAMTSNVYFRQPLSENIYITIFRPFQVAVWMAFLLCMFVSSLLVYKVHLFLEERFELGQCETDRFKKVKAFQVLLQMVQFICGRYFSSELKTNRTDGLTDRMSSTPNVSRKESVYSYQYFAILVTTYLSTFAVMVYTAKIAALFARNETVVKSTEDLLKLDYSLSSFSPMHFNKLFKHPEEARNTHQVNFPGGKAAVEKVVAPDETDPRYAFITHPDGFYPYARYSLNFTYEICTVSSFASTVRTPRSMFVKKGSHLREKINIKILHLIERGLNYRYQSSYNRKYNYKCTKETHAFAQLTNTHVSFAFIILTIGACVGVLIEFGIYVKSGFYYKRIFFEYFRIIYGKNSRIVRLPQLHLSIRRNSDEFSQATNLWGTVQHF